MSLTKSEKSKLKALKESLSYFTRNCLKIKTKDAKIEPFKLNQAQEHLHNELERLLKTVGKVRVLVVKGRQMGSSTYIAGRFYHKTSTTKALSTFILSHESNTTDKLFKMVKLFQENNPLQPLLKRSNAKELDFADLSSTYYVGTAGSSEVGRGGTVQLFHGSEVAMWKNTDDIQTGLMESIPDLPGTEIILESTAKGMGNFFHQMVTDSITGKNEYKVIFIPWFWMDEYETSTERFIPNEDDVEYGELYLQDFDEETTLRKLAWRRNKINTFSSDWKFKQEYPANVSEAFQVSGDTLIKAQDIVRARRNNIVGAEREALVIGCDPARNGDRTAIAFRRGRKLERYITYSDMNEMRLAGILGKFINEYNPIAVNIDTTNSWGVYDRLRELGFGVANGIHFGSKASESRLYKNKRAEMWCNMRDWIADDADLPDTDELHTDLVSVPDYPERSDGLIQLVSKDKIRQDSGLSPDIGDAIALTFAVPIAPLNTQVRKAVGGGLRTRRKR